MKKRATPVSLASAVGLSVGLSKLQFLCLVCGVCRKGIVIFTANIKHCTARRLLLLLAMAILLGISHKILLLEDDFIENQHHNHKHGNVEWLPKMPSLPDRTIGPRLEAMMADADDKSSLQNCRPTAQVQIQILQNGEIKNKTTNWILYTFDDSGTPKHQGGDEFYVTFHHHNDNNNNSNNNTDNNPPSAVAFITDRHDGSYELDFVVPPLLVANYNSSELQNTIGGGTLSVYLQYTCGMGFLAPPVKDEWTEGGALLQTTFSLKTQTSPPIRSFPPPKFPTSNYNNNITSLAKYQHVLVFGDSAMKQFAKDGNKAFYPNIVFRVKRRKPWTTALLQAHWAILEKQLGRDLAKAASQPRHSTALLLGSAIWDVLASTFNKVNHQINNTSIVESSLFGGNERQRQLMLIDTKPQPSNNNDMVDAVINSHSDSVFFDHLKACRLFIQHVRDKYPHVDIYWKSPTAMHIHVVKKDASSAAATTNHDANTEQRVQNAAAMLDRIRYMSTSRMFHLYQLQLELMRALQVPVLDIYPATYLSAAWTIPGDGRHYLPELHQHMLRWFY